tara:strand:- start:91 stop:411 length:321 start_codon:yes stop_codon:yes gene_type:complete
MAVQPGGYLDRPEDDNTQNAHPSFVRGRMKGTMDTLDIIRNIITGDDPGEGTINAGEVEKIRRAVFVMRDALVHASDKSTYLSKQAKEALDEAKRLADSLGFKKTS